MSEEDNKALIRRWFKEEVNEGNLTVVKDLFDPDVVVHDSQAGDRKGWEDGPKRAVEAFRTAFPDIHFTIENLITEDDKVVTRWTAHGTHQGQLQGLPPTGKRIQFTGIDIYRIADGRIAEVWISSDTLGLMQQLGAVPQSK